MLLNYFSVDLTRVEKRDLIRDDLRHYSLFHDYKKTCVQNSLKLLERPESKGSVQSKRKNLPHLNIKYNLEGKSVCRKIYEIAYDIGHSYTDDRYFI